METNRKATATDVSQRKVEELQSALNIIETEAKDDQAMSAEDVKFVGEFGWLAAAAVTIASIAANV
jgi:hypothetical protein